MLDQNSNINAAIAVILLYKKSIYNAQELRWDYSLDVLENLAGPN